LQNARIALAIIVLAITVFSGAVEASTTKGHTITITGTIGVGSLDSVIEAPDGTSVGFLTNSLQAKAIFATCKYQDICQVTGTVRGSGIYTFFVKITKVKIIKQAAAGG
jgi:hypothetical protein